MSHPPKKMILRISTALIVGLWVFVVASFAIWKGQTTKEWLEILKLGAETSALVIAAAWGAYKLIEYRDLMRLIEFDAKLAIFKLSQPERIKYPNSPKDGTRWEQPGGEPVEAVVSHLVEVQLIFRNKGKTRFRLFNAQIGLNTMRQPGEIRFDKAVGDSNDNARAPLMDGNGHVHLTRIFTSGNLVPKMPVRDRPINLTSFFYVEPGIEQVITYVAAITSPREVLQLYAEFSLAQERLFPGATRSSGGLYPHNIARTYAVTDSGLLGEQKTGCR
jgi:hypothetical protein